MVFEGGHNRLFDVGLGKRMVWVAAELFPHFPIAAVDFVMRKGSAYDIERSKRGIRIFESVGEVFFISEFCFCKNS